MYKSVNCVDAYTCDKFSVF